MLVPTMTFGEHGQRSVRQRRKDHHCSQDPCHDAELELPHSIQQALWPAWRNARVIKLVSEVEAERQRRIRAERQLAMAQNQEEPRPW